MQDNYGVSSLPELLSSSRDSAAAEKLLKQTIQLVGKAVEYKDLMMMYTCAIKEIQTKFEILNIEFGARYKRNPISNISSRLKSTMSIADKLERRGLPFTLECVKENIKDVAGVRVVCSYIDDIYLVADSLIQQDDITLIERKDYISQPKPNGYRSLHLIVQVPVFFASCKVDMTVEVQIRTIAMNFWASLEHQLKYKQEIPNQREIISQLKECADASNATDERMLQIRRQIEAYDTAETNEKDILIRQLNRLNM